MFNLKSRKSMKKTWSMILKVIIAVAGAIAGVKMSTEDIMSRLRGEKG